jgi:hypothetical protein
MMVTMNRQDLQTTIEAAKSKIIERLVTKYDVQSACDHAVSRAMSGLQELHQENQIMLRRSSAQRDQLYRKAAVIETRIANMEQDIRNIQDMLIRLTESIRRTSVG